MFSHLVLLFICIQMNLKLEVDQGRVFFFGPAPDNVISLCKLCHANVQKAFFFLGELEISLN